MNFGGFFVTSSGPISAVHPKMLRAGSWKIEELLNVHLVYRKPLKTPKLWSTLTSPITSTLSFRKAPTLAILAIISRYPFHKPLASEKGTTYRLDYNFPQQKNLHVYIEPRIWSLLACSKYRFIGFNIAQKMQGKKGDYRRNQVNYELWIFQKIQEISKTRNFLARKVFSNSILAAFSRDRGRLLC